MAPGRTGSLETLRRLNRLRVIDALRDELLIEAGVDEARVIGAGMCLPGPIHRPTGVVGSTAILPGWVGVAAAEEMHRRLELPILVDNDANLAALAEAAFGAGRDAKDLVYLMISSGIGAGLVLNGRLYRGAEGLAGELGHVLVDADGPVCRCGNRGCLETVAGTDALADLLRRSHGDGLDGRTIVRLAREGDLGCRRVIADAGRAIGKAAATLVNVLNPELLIVGVRESLGRSALPTAVEAATVVAGTLGDRAEVLGAIALVLSEAEHDH